MTTLPARLVALRPAQWVKNVPVGAPLLFGHRLGDPAARLATLWTFFAFCAVASAGYLVNDVRDLTSDRVHPRRRARPVARGDVGPCEALVTASVLAAAALTCALALLPPGVAAVLGGYLALSLAYSLALKRSPPLAVLAVSLGFVARVLAGAHAARVPPSPWLLALVGVLALALAVGKREAEARRLARPAARTLSRGTDLLLLAAWLGYLAYGLSPATIALHGTRALPLTSLPVAAALLRFRARLRADATGLGPAELIGKDPLLLALGAAWVASCALAVTGGAP